MRRGTEDDSDTDEEGLSGSSSTAALRGSSHEPQAKMVRISYPSLNPTLWEEFTALPVAILVHVVADST